MIDPLEITDFNRSTAQREEFILNAITFAGKNSRQQAPKMHALLTSEKGSPFELIRRWNSEGQLLEKLREIRIGKYGLLSQSFTQLAHSGIDLHTCSVDELQQFPGIGPKTARFFILHSRPNQELVVLDTHLLKEMRALGLTNLIAPPPEKKYKEIEKTLIEYLKEKGIVDFAQYDLATWKKYIR